MDTKVKGATKKVAEVKEKVMNVDEQLDLRTAEDLASTLLSAHISDTHMGGAVSQYGVKTSGDYKVKGVFLKKFEDNNKEERSFAYIQLESGEKLSLSSVLGRKAVYDSITDASNAVRKSNRGESNAAVLPATTPISLQFSTNYLESIPQIKDTIHVEIVDGYKFSEFGLTAENDKALKNAKSKVVKCQYYDISHVEETAA